MKRLYIAVALFLAFAKPVWADESISDYRTKLDVRADSTVLVTETILYDFGDAERHGIFRDIPKDSQGGPHVVIRDVAVVNAASVTQPFTLSQDSGSVHIRIGDPDVTVTGKHAYVITYTALNAVRYFTDHDEVYWNVIPGGFAVPIAISSADIMIPDGITATDVTCTTGPEGSIAKDCSFMQKNGVVHVRSTGPLGNGEGMTIAVSIPPGVITHVAPVKDSVAGLIIAILVFIFIALIVVLAVAAVILSKIYTYKLPRRRTDGGEIVVQYDPPDHMSAARCGFLAKRGDVFTASILQLAVQGWLQLTFTKHKGWFRTTIEVSFSRRKEGIPSDAFDSQILDIVTPGGEPAALNDLKTLVRSGSLKITTVVSTLTGILERDGILTRGGPLRLFRIPSVKGREALEHIAGLRIYLNAAEKERLEFHNAPAKTPETFEKLLPYAVALGVDKPWQEEFADVYRQPEWAKGDFDNTGLGFQAAMAQLSSDAQSTVNAYSSGSSGSGGGSSGGGSGGGGGGSW